MAEASSERDGILDDPSGLGIPVRDVFISHRNCEEDIALSREICRGLESADVTSWLDKERLAGGTSYRREITEAIRQARAVVVIFDQDPSDWLIFEAGCAFFDHKLIPVAINGAPVPEPFSGIQAIELPNAGDPERDLKMRELVRLCKHRVHGQGAGSLLLRIARFVYGLFRSGLSVFYIVFAAALTFVLGIMVSSPVSNGARYDMLHHTHAVLGMLTLGGGLYIPIFFARSQASPSFRERQFGGKLVHELFVVWLATALVLVLFGALMLMVSERRYDLTTTWVSLSLILYLLSLLMWVIGMMLSREATTADAQMDRRRFTIMAARASVIFLVAFAINVFVVNLMMFRYEIGAGVATNPIVHGRIGN